jgi:hypothetical protein
MEVARRVLIVAHSKLVYISDMQKLRICQVQISVDYRGAVPHTNSAASYVAMANPLLWRSAHGKAWERWSHVSSGMSQASSESGAKQMAWRVDSLYRTAAAPMSATIQPQPKVHYHTPSICWSADMPVISAKISDLDKPIDMQR